MNDTNEQSSIGPRLQIVGAMPTASNPDNPIIHNPSRLNCQCNRCKAARERWRAAAQMEDQADVLMLPANGFAAERMRESLTPWSLERRSMHFNAVSAEDEFAAKIRHLEDEGKQDVVVAEKRLPKQGDIEIKRFEIEANEIELDNLLNEINN